MSVKITVRELMELDKWFELCEMRWEEMKGRKFNDVIEVSEEDAKKLGLQTYKESKNEE